MQRRSNVSCVMGLAKLVIIMVAALAVFVPVVLGQQERVSQGEILMGQNFWCVPWTGSDPFKPDCKNVHGPDVWKDGFIEEVTPYHIIRFMDWNHTNKHYLDTAKRPKPGFMVSDDKWTSRRQKDDPNQQVVAYEWQVEACNRTRSHGWFCVPDRADEDYCLRLAILIKTGVDMLEVDLKPYGEKLQEMTAEDFIRAGGKKTGEPLAAGLRAYLEYSNETWLFQWANITAEGKKLGLSPNEYHAYMSVRLFHAFERVFGKNSDRIRKVVCGQAGNTGHGVKRLEAIYSMHPVVNPGLIDRIDAYAIATYWGKSPREEKALGRWLRHKKNVVDRFGVEFYFYEGGNGGAMPSGGEGRGAVRNDNAMYDAYQDYYAAMKEAGFSAGCHYMHSGTGEWACIRENGVGLEKAMAFTKYKAIVEWCRRIPLPGPRAGNAADAAAQ